ncbi:hypothetical protein, partial [Pseudomonas yamanorum]|uniref:hypothetical protein n=1 Tax=Pseudomonas yamanorum TaxID=515393 RepID=UPI001C4351FA
SDCPIQPKGTPSHSKAPTSGAEPFAYFGLGRHSGFSKVTRCKSGTLSSRYRSNRYVLNPHKNKTKKRRPKSPKMPCVLMYPEKT